LELLFSQIPKIVFESLFLANSIIFTARLNQKTANWTYFGWQIPKFFAARLNKIQSIGVVFVGKFQSFSLRFWSYLCSQIKIGPKLLGLNFEIDHTVPYKIF
jgi:hypothetical protein